MVVSIGAYTLLWGWKFALGFVLLLFVHEAGHALEAKRQGMPVSAPLFIPFLGAVIALKQMPQDAWKRGADRARRADRRQPRRRGRLVVRRGDRQQPADRARLHGLLPQPVQPARRSCRSTAAARSPPSIPPSGSSACSASASLTVFVPEPDPDPDPGDRRARALEPLAARGTTRRRRRTTASPGWQRVAVAVVYLGLAAALGVAMSASYIERDI